MPNTLHTFVLWLSSTMVTRRIVFWNACRSEICMCCHLVPTASQYMKSVMLNWKNEVVNGNKFTWWRYQIMETFSALLVLCAGNSLVTSEFPAQRPMTRSFDACFYLCLNKRLSWQENIKFPTRFLKMICYHCVPFLGIALLFFRTDSIYPFGCCVDRHVSVTASWGIQITSKQTYHSVNIGDVRHGNTFSITEVLW